MSSRNLLRFIIIIGVFSRILANYVFYNLMSRIFTLRFAGAHLTESPSDKLTQGVGSITGGQLWGDDVVQETLRLEITGQ